MIQSKILSPEITILIWREKRVGQKKKKKKKKGRKIEVNSVREVRITKIEGARDKEREREAEGKRNGKVLEKEIMREEWLLLEKGRVREELDERI